MNERTIEKVLEFHVSPVRVWRAITEPEEEGELIDLLGIA